MALSIVVPPNNDKLRGPRFLFIERPLQIVKDYICAKLSVYYRKFVFLMESPLKKVPLYIYIYIYNIHTVAIANLN